MKCEHCGSTENLTKDHIIPRWLYRRVGNLKLNGFKKNLGQANIQILCSDCNIKKGGSIYICDENSLSFWLAVRDAIDKEINRACS